MKILIMNDFLVYGGAEVQGMREKKNLENNGHEVYMLTFDCNFPLKHEIYNKKNNFINIPIKKSNLKKILNCIGLFKINNKLLKKIKEEIKNISPDIIHVNNLNLDSFTQYKSVEEYKVIQTIRDYSAVCPLGTCIKKDGSICEGEKYNNCLKECKKDIKTLSKILLNINKNKAKKQTIKNYLCPSEKLTEYCKNNEYNIRCINNPFDFDKFIALEKNIDFKKKTYLYYGAINKNKGVLELIDAFNLFDKNKDVQLLIAGNVSKEIENDFKNKVNGNSKIKYLGKLEYDNMIKVLEKVYTIVVPSVWMENYPNTVLEGLSTGTFVIGSNRGGIPEMLSDNRGYTFDVTSIDDIIKTLEKSYNLSIEKYKEIVEKNKKYVKENNSFSTYYSRLMNEFNRN